MKTPPNQPPYKITPIEMAMQHNVYTVHFDYAFLVFDFWALRLYFLARYFVGR